MSFQIPDFNAVDWNKEYQKVSGGPTIAKAGTAADNAPTGTDWLGWAGVGMSGLDAIGSVLNARTARRNYRLQRDAFNFNKEMQSATSLANLQDRMQLMQRFNPDVDISHYQNLANRLQSYLPNQQPQQTTMPAPNQQPMVQQAQPQGYPQPMQQPQGYSQPQPRQPNNGFTSMANYGRGGY